MTSVVSVVPKRRFALSDLTPDFGFALAGGFAKQSLARRIPKQSLGTTGLEAKRRFARRIPKRRLGTTGGRPAFPSDTPPAVGGDSGYFHPARLHSLPDI